MRAAPFLSFAAALALGCSSAEKDSGAPEETGGGVGGDGSDGSDGSDGGDGADGGEPLDSGVTGVVMWLEGNHMPPGEGPSWPVSVPVAAFAPLPSTTANWSGDPEAYGLYELSVAPLAATTSDEEGRFTLGLEPGDYSLLVGDPEHEGLWYCNGFTDTLCPLAVGEGELVEQNVNIDYRAAY